MTKLRLDAATFSIPHPDKVHYGGEDACCYDEDLQLMVVADGVGGFHKQNESDVADYSRSLVHEVHKYFRAAQRKGYLHRTYGIGAQQAIDVAHKRVRKEGASTLCVARFHQQIQVLEVASVGDSRTVVYRNGRVAWSSCTQQHYFNCPFQLGYPMSCNTARDAFVYYVPLLPGDIIVMGTDGVWDNVWDEEVMQYMPRCASELLHAAEAVATAAFKHTLDDEYYSPFAAGSFGSSVDWPCGGKPDDITVVVARVTAEQTSAADTDSCCTSAGRGSPSLSISSTSSFDPTDICFATDETTSADDDDDDSSSCSSSLFDDISEYLFDERLWNSIHRPASAVPSSIQQHIPTHSSFSGIRSGGHLPSVKSACQGTTPRANLLPNNEFDTMLNPRDSSSERAPSLQNPGLLHAPTLDTIIASPMQQPPQDAIDSLESSDSSESSDSVTPFLNARSSVYADVMKEQSMSAGDNGIGNISFINNPPAASPDGRTPNNRPTASYEYGMPSKSPAAGSGDRMPRAWLQTSVPDFLQGEGPIAFGRIPSNILSCLVEGTPISQENANNTPAAVAVHNTEFDTTCLLGTNKPQPQSEAHLWCCQCVACCYEEDEEEHVTFGKWHWEDLQILLLDIQLAHIP